MRFVTGFEVVQTAVKLHFILPPEV